MTADNSLSQRRAIIWGVGGSGKTELAANYALQYSEDFRAIFFINAKNVQTVRKDYADIAWHLGLSEALTAESADKGDDLSAQDTAIEAVKTWFVDNIEGDWLLIIDNADDLESVNIQEYIPPTKKGHIILTSQDRRTASLGPAIELEEMKQEDAEKLFLEKACITDPTREQSTVCAEIVTKLGRLALAVEHAGAYVHDNAMAHRLEDYLQDFKNKRQQVLDESPQFSLHKQSMMATYLMARMSIINRNLNAGYLLGLLGALDGSAVHERLLLSSSTINCLRLWQLDYSNDYDAAKKVLLSFSLIRIHNTDDGPAISMHGLVHQCVQARLEQRLQWWWLENISIILTRATEQKQFDNSYFPHLRHLLERVEEREKLTDIGKPSTRLWTYTTFLIFTHQNFFANAGLNQELYKYSQLVIDGLEKETGEKEVGSLALVTLVQANASAYTNTQEMYDLVLKRYLKKKMNPSAAAAVDRVENGLEPAATFRPSSLAEVFQNTEFATVASIIPQYCREVSRGCISRNQPELSSLFYRISHLPVKDTWKARLTTFFVLLLSYVWSVLTGTKRAEMLEAQEVIAARDRLHGSLQSTIQLLREIMAQQKPGEKLHERALYDLFKLLLKQGRTSEATELVDKLMYPNADLSEADIARIYGDLYIWLRKAKVLLLLKKGHVRHDEVKEVLLQTLETAKIVSGAKSMMTLHAMFLFELVYSQECCNDAATATAYREEGEDVFTALYGGTPSKARRQVGLMMGKVLLSQGALTEAVGVFRLYVKVAKKEFGEEDALTREAERLLSVAERERAEELEEEKEGRVSMKWGSITFARNISLL